MCYGTGEYGPCTPGHGHPAGILTKCKIIYLIYDYYCNELT